MGKYKVYFYEEVTQHYSVDVEADSEDEARDIIHDTDAIEDFECEELEKETSLVVQSEKTERLR